MSDSTSIALVTGGNRGIGLAIAKALKADGHKVIITYRSGTPPTGFDAVQMDVTDSQSVDAGFTKIESEFGQPEIKLGVIAGIGGTQRMTKLIGRAKSMDMHLTGRMMGAEEALNCGLIARIFPDEELVENALGIAEIISQYSKPALTMITNSIHKSDNLTLEQGLKYERSLFYSLFDTNDQKEGMKAFIEKRKPTFNGT